SADDAVALRQEVDLSGLIGGDAQLDPKGPRPRGTSEPRPRSTRTTSRRRRRWRRRIRAEPLLHKGGKVRRDFGVRRQGGGVAVRSGHQISHPRVKQSAARDVAKDNGALKLRPPLAAIGKAVGDRKALDTRPV